MDAAQARRWLRRYHTSRNATTRLVVLPHAGGSATFYHPLSAAVSPALDVQVVQYPGRQERQSEPGLTDLLELADFIVAALTAQGESGPTAIFGHSMGATLGFEIARRLETMGVRVPVLFASGRRAPSRRKRTWLSKGITDERLLRELKLLGGTDPRALHNQEMLRMILPAMRSDYQAIEAYTFSPVPKPRLSAAVVALAGAADPSTSPEDIAAWADHTSGPFSLRVFSGNHFYLAQQWPSVAATVTRELAGVLTTR